MAMKQSDRSSPRYKARYPRLLLCQRRLEDQRRHDLDTEADSDSDY